MSAESGAGAGKPGRTPPAEALPPAGFALLAALSLFWGLNWLFMKIALSDLARQLDPAGRHELALVCAALAVVLVLPALRRPMRA